MIPLVAMAAANVVVSLQKETRPSTLSEIAEATAEEYGIPTVRLLGKGCGSVHEVVFCCFSAGDNAVYEPLLNLPQC